MVLKKLDIHVHVQLEHEYPVHLRQRATGLTCGELREMYDVTGVEKGLALPGVSP